MSAEKRKSFLSSSSQSIDNIRRSVTNLAQGLVSSAKAASDVQEQTRKTAIFKQSLIGKDNEFFKRRRENVLRKQREDELEETSVNGVTKKTQELPQKSTRGFLGRVLDFIATLLIGWALTTLPQIIKAFQKMFVLITKVVGVLSGFLKGVGLFFTGIGGILDNFLGVFKRFDFIGPDKQIKEGVDNATTGLVKLNKDFVEGVRAFTQDPDIQKAGEVAQSLGIEQDETNNLNALVSDAEGEASSTVDKELNKRSNEQENTVSKEELDTLNAEQIEDRDEGGEVTAGEPYLIGVESQSDKTPELFVPEQSGEVIPQDEIGGEQGVEEMAKDSLEEESEGGAESFNAISKGGGSSETKPKDGDEFKADAEKLKNIDLEKFKKDDKEKEGNGDNVEGTPTTVDLSETVVPLKKDQMDLRKPNKGTKVIVMAPQDNNGGGNGGGMVSAGGGGVNRGSSVAPQDSSRILSDLQSLNLKHS